MSMIQSITFVGLCWIFFLRGLAGFNGHSYRGCEVGSRTPFPFPDQVSGVSSVVSGNACKLSATFRCRSRCHISSHNGSSPNQGQRSSHLGTCTWVLLQLASPFRPIWVDRSRAAELNIGHPPSGTAHLRRMPAVQPQNDTNGSGRIPSATPEPPHMGHGSSLDMTRVGSLSGSGLGSGAGGARFLI